MVDIVERRFQHVLNLIGLYELFNGRLSFKFSSLFVHSLVVVVYFVGASHFLIFLQTCA